MAYQTINPFIGDVQRTFEYLPDNTLQEKLNLADITQHSWKAESFKTRAKLLLKVADLLTQNSDEYAELITFEMGKPISQSIGEVKKCAWLCKYYAEKGSDFLQDRRIESTAEVSQVSYDPLGVVLAVMPCNFPFWQVFRFIVPAVMAGNGGLLKHASNVPQCALAIEKVFMKSGFPVGLFQNLFISHKQVEDVIASPIVKAVTLTGSNEAGSRIAELSGRYIKKTVLELGGSDPFIVFEDADLNHALELAVLSKFLNAGQSCIAAKRFIIHEDIAEEFIKNFTALIENFVVGDPMKKETFLGPMVNENSVLEVDRQVQETIKMGGKCLIGGKRDENTKNIYLPTLITNVPIDSPLWEEEVFGPVAVVQIFSSDNDALTLANDSKFGLGASVWTSDMDRANLFAEKLETGTVAINNMVKSEPGLPFGGIKDSGYGRELSDYGIYEFMNIKTVSYS